MKKIIITPKYDGTDINKILEFASNTYKIDMRCNQFNDSTILFRTLNESDFPFRIINIGKNCICTNNGIYIYNKGTFRAYQIELQDDEYYLEKNKHYRIETVDGYFPIFTALKTEVYKTLTNFYVKEFVSHKKRQLFGINTLCNFNAINILELSPLEYIQHKQSILSGTEPTRQQLDSLKSKPNILINRDIDTLQLNSYSCNPHPSVDLINKRKKDKIESHYQQLQQQSEIIGTMYHQTLHDLLDLKPNNSILIELDNSKTNGLQPFSIKLELDSLNTKSNMELNPLN